MRYLITFLIMSGLALADIANMSGTWALDVDRSRFGDNPHPSNVTLTIQHNDPKLKYEGVVNHPNEGHIIDFRFDGAIDGREYTIKEDRGERRVTFRRVNDNVVESTSTWSDGELKSRLTVSGDGRTIERRMEFRDRTGKKREWVEIYEKKQ